jgi:hypothetical protein
MTAPPLARMKRQHTYQPVGRCIYCGATGVVLTLEHLIPESHHPARRSSIRQRNRLRLGLRIEPRQNRLERHEPGRERVAICIDGGSQKSGERIVPGVGKFKLCTVGLSLPQNEFLSSTKLSRFLQPRYRYNTDRN